MHKLNWSRKKVVTSLTIVGCLLSILFTTGIGTYLLEIVDTFINSFCLIILIAIQCIVFTWLIDINQIINVINENSSFNIGKIWKVIVKYVLPIFLLVMWVVGVVELCFSTNSFQLTVYGIILVAVLLVSIIFTRIKSESN